MKWSGTAYVYWCLIILLWKNDEKALAAFAALLLIAELFGAWMGPAEIAL